MISFKGRQTPKSVIYNVLDRAPQYLYRPVGQYLPGSYRLDPVVLTGYAVRVNSILLSGFLLYPHNPYRHIVLQGSIGWGLNPPTLAALRRVVPLFALSLALISPKPEVFHRDS